MPVAQRAAMRTYTIACRAGKVGINFEFHGETGPASRWAIHAAAGEPIQIVAPDRQFSAQDAGGFEWKPPQQLKHLLLVADATALPAAKRTFSICAIYLISDPTVEDEISRQICAILRSRRDSVAGSLVCRSARKGAGPHRPSNVPSLAPPCVQSAPR